MNFKDFIARNKLRIAEGGCLVLTAAIVLTAAVTITYQRFTSTGRYRREYSGRIVDKQTRFYESERGSSMGRYLIIEEKDGRRSEVIVSEDIYNQASVGMWIERSDRGTELVPSQ
jgi:hypothetical protein